MDKALSGKVALVTGGSRGIGAAAARALAAAGADVAIGYQASADKAQQVVRDIESHGVRGLALQADQADAKQVAALVRGTVERLGRLDILVNNAGVFVTGPLTESEDDIARFAHQQAVNVGGVVAAVRAAIAHLPEGGRVISIGSVLGERSLWPGMADYGASKAAVVGYTRGWARDLGPRGITVNVIQPGPIDTDMNPADGDGADGQRAGTALGRYGKPEEIAAAVVFLASPQASFITGAVLDVDGGVLA